MSLDLGAEGFAYNTVKVANTTAALGAITLATFNAGDDASLASKLMLQVDNSGATPSADIIADLPAPVALGVVGGTEIVIINDTNGKKLNVTDPITGLSLSYANRVGESVTIVADGDGDQWVFSF
jgi:hypothetical protein